MQSFRILRESFDAILESQINHPRNGDVWQLCNKDERQILGNGGGCLTSMRLLIVLELRFQHLRMKKGFQELKLYVWPSPTFHSWMNWSLPTEVRQRITTFRESLCEKKIPECLLNRLCLSQCLLDHRLPPRLLQLKSGYCKRA